MPATRDRPAAHGEPAGGGPVAQALPSGVGSERQRDRPGGKRIAPGTRIICGLPALLPESGGGPVPFRGPPPDGARAPLGGPVRRRGRRTPPRRTRALTNRALRTAGRSRRAPSVEPARGRSGYPRREGAPGERPQGSSTDHDARGVYPEHGAGPRRGPRWNGPNGVRSRVPGGPCHRPPTHPHEPTGPMRPDNTFRTS